MSGKQYLLGWKDFISQTYMSQTSAPIQISALINSWSVVQQLWTDSVNDFIWLQSRLKFFDHLTFKVFIFSYLFFFVVVVQKLPRPTDRSPNQVWRKMPLTRRKKAARTSGSKLAPETRLPSLAKLTLSAHPSLIYLVGTSGTLFEDKNNEPWMLMGEVFKCLHASFGNNKWR